MLPVRGEIRESQQLEHRVQTHGATTFPARGRVSATGNLFRGFPGRIALGQVWGRGSDRFSKNTATYHTMKINVLKTAFNKAALAALALIGFAAAPAGAQNPNYAPGDILLFFQQFGGTQTVMVNLGAATTYRDATANLLNIVNISGALTGATPAGAAFGSTWYDDPTIFWGLAGVRSASINTTTVVNGDPNRTVYASRERTALGTEGSASSTAWSIGDLTTAATNIITQNNRMETQSLTTTLVEPTSASVIDAQHLFNLGGTPTSSFTVFSSGGVQGDFGAGLFGTFGGVAAEGALDLYRLLAASPGGTVESGPLNVGQYQGTFVIDQAGSVSYIAPVPEPATLSLLAASVIVGLARRRRAQRV